MGYGFRASPKETRTGKSTVTAQLDSYAGKHFPNILTGCWCQSRRGCCSGILADPRKPLCKQSGDVLEQMRGVKEPCLSWYLHPGSYCSRPIIQLPE